MHVLPRADAFFCVPTLRMSMLSVAVVRLPQGVLILPLRHSICPAVPTWLRMRRCRPLAPPCQPASTAHCLTCLWRWQAPAWQAPPRPPRPMQVVPCCRAAPPPCCCARGGPTGTAVPAGGGTGGHRVQAARLARWVGRGPARCPPAFSAACRSGRRPQPCSSPRPAAPDLLPVHVTWW